MHGLGIIKARKQCKLHGSGFHKATKPCKVPGFGLIKAQKTVENSWVGFQQVAKPSNFNSSTNFQSPPIPIQSPKPANQYP